MGPPVVQEGQSQPSLQYQGLPILDHNSASGLRETGTLPFGLPAARSQELLPNLAARAPVTNGSENRENPDTLLQCVSQPTTNRGLPHPYPPPLAATAGSHYPHQINLTFATQTSLPINKDTHYPLKVINKSVIILEITEYLLRMKLHELFVKL